MKKLLLILGLFIGFVCQVFSQGGSSMYERSPRILIYYSAKGESGNRPNAGGMKDWGSEEFAKDILLYLVSELNSEVSCAKVITKDDIRFMIKNDRERALLGSEDSRLEEIGRAMGCDFLINITAYRNGENLSFFSSTGSARKANVVDKKLEFSNIENYQDDRTKFVKNIVLTLLEMQICPYKGNFFYEYVITSSETKETGGQSQDHESLYSHSKFKRTTEISEKWDFDKKSKIGANGRFNFKYEELYDYTAEGRSRCLKCEDGVLIDEFYPPSNWSESEKKQLKGTCNKLAPVDPKLTVYDAIVELEFDAKDETFMIKVKAVSDSSTFHESKASQLNSKCPCPPKKAPDYPDKQTRFVKSLKRSFGPYKGKITDKTLWCVPKTEVYVSEDGKGKSTYTYGFNLKR